MDLFEVEAVELTRINKVIVGHDVYKPGQNNYFCFCFVFWV